MPRNECSFLLDGTERCSRKPVVVDVFEDNAVTGSHWITSNCARHWGKRAQEEAAYKGYSWTLREPVAGLTVAR